MSQNDILRFPEGGDISWFPVFSEIRDRKAEKTGNHKMSFFTKAKEQRNVPAEAPYRRGNRVHPATSSCNRFRDSGEK
jgi:hypothetical protein